VVQARRDASKISDAVTVGVREGARIDLVDDAQRFSTAGVGKTGSTRAIKARSAS
jgi:hypothetical protein